VLLRHGHLNPLQRLSCIHRDSRTWIVSRLAQSRKSRLRLLVKQADVESSRPSDLRITVVKHSSGKGGQHFGRWNFRSQERFHRFKAHAPIPSGQSQHQPVAAAVGCLLLDCQAEWIFKPAVFIHIPATADNLTTSHVSEEGNSFSTRFGAVRGGRSRKLPASSVCQIQWEPKGQAALTSCIPDYKPLSNHGTLNDSPVMIGPTPSAFCAPTAQ
jgi:hypothetical protein